MTAKLELRIPPSSSRHLLKALRLARTFEDFREPRGRSDSYTIRVGQDELRIRYKAVERLYRMTRGWRGTELRVAGKPADLKAMNAIVSVFRCAEHRDLTAIPDAYCQPGEEGWGCKHLDQIRADLPVVVWQLDQTNYAFWFQFGEFTQDGKTWKVDKPALRKALMREASAKHLTMCPFFSRDRIKQRVAALPANLELGEGSAWAPRCKTDMTGAGQRQPFGIQPRELDRDDPLSLSVSVDPEPDGTPKQERQIPVVSFQDIGGMDEVVTKVREVVELPIRHPELMKHLGITPHKGVILYGPPGCGKTLLAKAIANEVNAHFASVKGPELYSKWVGESEERLRALFDHAREFAPSIVFFDEIDAIASRRSGNDANRHSAAFLNQLLTLMDGVETYTNVFILGATNRLELLDEAILRPGRFDYALEVKRPSPEGCRKILGIHTHRMPLGAGVDLDAIAAELEGRTGAEIAYVAREAAYNCLRRRVQIEDLVGEGGPEVDFSDFEVSEQDFMTAVQGASTGRSGTRASEQNGKPGVPISTDPKPLPKTPKKTLGKED